jgi:selT/selW/selH-like putative selenoprotein
LADELISEYGDDLESINLVKGQSGMFEVSLDGSLIYSKQQTRRHPEPGEILKSIASKR